MTPHDSNPGSSGPCSVDPNVQQRRAGLRTPLPPPTSLFHFFPDPECPSGRRYGGLAGVGLTGECVAPQEGSTGIAQTSSTSTSTSDATSTTSTGGEAEATSLESTTAPGSSEDGGSSSTSGMLTADGSSSTGDPPSCATSTFFDAFDRPADSTLDNGWDELRAGAFSLVDEAAVVDSPATAGHRNLVVRPETEAGLDTTASMTFRYEDGTSEPGEGYPQLYLRTTTDGNDVTGYACVVTRSGPGTLELRRYIDDEGIVLESVGIDDLPVFTPSWRLEFTVQNTDPVEFECRLEREGEVVGTLVTTDAGPEALQTAGTAGFSTALSGAFGGQPLDLAYDDFQYDVTVCKDG
jgi:hypothetical protein